MGISASLNTDLWKDQVLVELNKAVLYSYKNTVSALSITIRRRINLNALKNRNKTRAES